MGTPVLEVIDPALGQLFDQDPSVKVTFRYDGIQSTIAQCDGLQWLAKYALCTNNVDPANAICTDGQSLIDYLKSVAGSCTE